MDGNLPCFSDDPRARGWLRRLCRHGRLRWCEHGSARARYHAVRASRCGADDMDGRYQRMAEGLGAGRIPWRCCRASPPARWLQRDELRLGNAAPYARRQEIKKRSNTMPTRLVSRRLTTFTGIPSVLESAVARWCPQL